MRGAVGAMASIFLMVQPELFVLQHDFLEVFKCDDHRVDLAQLTELEEFNRGDLGSIARKMLEDYKKKIELMIEKRCNQ